MTMLSPPASSPATLGVVLGACFAPLLAFTVAAATAAPEAPMQLKEVIICFKTHFDIGYTDMASNVVQRYRTTMMDQAMKVVEQNRDLPPEQQFVWTLPGWPLSKILEPYPGQTEERRARMLRAFQEGRFVVHALPFTMHTELLELEDLVRGLGFASRLSRAVHLELPRDAKMTDVPCHSWVMPTLLRHAGVDFLHLGCNAASRSPQIPALFWWEGPDGSRLLTMYTAESYGTGLMPPKPWSHKTWLALIHTGDNHGPPNPDEVSNLLEEARIKLPGIKVRIGRLSDFGDAIVAEKAVLPVVRGDMPDSWIHGPMCDPAGAKSARNTRPLIAATEALGTELKTLGVAVPDPANVVANAYEQSLLYGEHTWGGALYWVMKYSEGRQYSYGDLWKNERAQGRFQKLEASWAEHTAYIEAARDGILPVLANQMDALARAVHCEGSRIVVYNPLPWKRDGWVTVKTDATMFPGGLLVSQNDQARFDVQEDEIRFVARNLPPMGYATYQPVSGNPRTPLLGVDRGKAVLENKFFRLTLDPARGCIRSWIDKRTGHELADPKSAHGLGQYLYERFDSNQVSAYVKAYVKINADWAINELGKPNLPPADQVPYRAFSPKECQLSLEQNSSSAAAVMRAPAGSGVPHAVTTKVVLYADQPYVDLEVTVHDKPADPWPEAGWICLPFRIDTPQFHLGRLASIIDPIRDIVPGANRHLMGINSGLTITDRHGSGVGLCAMDHPLVSLDTPGCWKFSMDFVPRKPSVYVNLFNNQWTTNFRLWNQGTWTSRIRLWAFDHYRSSSSLVAPSYEARLPLLAAAAHGSAGTLALNRTGLELSRHGVVVTAFGPNPDGSGTVLRLWELSGLSGKCQVRLPAGMSANHAQPVDLRGRPQDKSIRIQNGAFVAPMRAFAPTSYVLE